MTITDVLIDWAKYRRPLLALLGPGPSRRDRGFFIALGYTNAAIPARQDNTWSSGEVELCDTSLVSPPTTPATATCGDAMGKVTAYNWTGGEVPAHVMVVVVGIGNLVVVIAQDCSGVSQPAPPKPPTTTPTVTLAQPTED